MLVPLFVYISVFYVHLRILSKTGPHDSLMSSAFQASLQVFIPMLMLVSIVCIWFIDMVYCFMISVRNSLLLA